jgi:hypothetical protein
MNRFISPTVAAIASTLLSSTAFAQDGNVRVGAGVSTLGANLEAAYRLNDRFAIRGVISGGLSRNTTQAADGVNYDANARLGGFSLLADYYTGNSGFRVSGGAFLSNSSITGVATPVPGSPIDIGLTTLAAGNTVNAEVKFARRISPMLTVGYDWNIGSAFTLSGEVGAIAMGGLTPTISTAIPIPQADIDREINTIQNELNQAGQFYPYIAITASYRF